MNCKEIIAEKLMSMGADGLCTIGCGCGMHELILCDSNPSDCVPAKKTFSEVTDNYFFAGDVIYVPMEQEEK